MLAGALELFLVALGLIYFVGTTASGLRVIRGYRRASHPRRKPAPAGRRAQRHASSVQLLSAQRSSARRWMLLLWHKATTADQPVPRAGVALDPAENVVYFIVPCLNEERVIEESLRNLLADPRGTVVVVDDASEDRTARIAASVDRDRVIVLHRELPDARLGKGPALNAGFARVLEDVALRGVPASRVTVCVMDADGRLSDGALDAVLPLFSDERVGGVQLPVRIRRVRGSILTLLQDLEFWGVCAVAQLGRIGCGTVSLGGNGQFTRLSALLELGTKPWRARLTEDLDLALALATAGWRLTSTPQAYVSQQGLTRLRALINQRTRWYQGHMQAGRWMPRLWSSRRLSHLSMLEMTLYLLVPWALVLPWSLIFNYNLVLMALWVAGWVTEPGLGANATERVITVLIWYAVSCIPIWMAGYLYSRQRRKAGPFRALLLGHLLLLGNYITYVACWRAFFRLALGANSWQKTSRHRERSHRASRRQPADYPVAVAAAGTPVLTGLPVAAGVLAEAAVTGAGAGRLEAATGDPWRSRPRQRGVAVPAQRQPSRTEQLGIPALLAAGPAVGSEAGTGEQSVRSQARRARGSRGSHRSARERSPAVRR